MHYSKNPRFVSAAIGTAFALSLVLGTPLAQAATLTQVQIDSIVGLLQAFGADATTIANVQAALAGTPTTSTSVPSTTVSDCSALMHNLQIGSTDASTNGEVSRLQTLLEKDRTIYPEGLVTGYYGVSTKAAVERWQESHNIVSSGDAESTGFGAVGPMTRSELEKEMTSTGCR